MTVEREPPALDDAAVARLWSGITSRRRSLARRRQALALVAGLAAITLIVVATFQR